MIISRTCLLIALVLGSLIPSFVTLGNPSPSRDTTIGKAVDVAYNDFKDRLRQQSDSYKWDKSECDICDLVFNIRNYNIGVSISEKSIVVVFILRRDTIDVTGGGGEYWIDAETLKITKFLGYE